MQNDVHRGKKKKKQKQWLRTKHGNGEVTYQYKVSVLPNTATQNGVQI